MTYNAYAYTAKSHIISYFSSSGITVRQCSTEVLQVFFDEKFKNGRLDGKGGLSPKTIRSLYNILRQSFEKAVDDKIIALNPCDKVELPRKVRFKPKFYSAEQLNALHLNPILCYRLSELQPYTGYEEVRFLDSNGTV